MLLVLPLFYLASPINIPFTLLTISNKFISIRLNFKLSAIWYLWSYPWSRLKQEM